MQREPGKNRDDTGAAGNHQPLTGSRMRNSVDAVSARNSTAEKMMYAGTRSNAPRKCTSTLGFR